MEDIRKLKQRKEVYRMDLIQAWRPFLQRPGNVKGPESCFMLVVQYNIKVSIILKMVQKKSYWAFREKGPRSVSPVFPLCYPSEKVDNYLLSVVGLWMLTAFRRNFFI